MSFGRIVVFVVFVASASLSVSGRCPTGPQANLVQQPKPAETLKTFLGTIVKDGDKFVLSDDARKVWYELDDQATVSKFSGKKVKVKGTFDATKNLIRVQSIEETST